MKTILLAATRFLMRPHFILCVLFCSTNLISINSFAQCTPVGDPSVFGNNVWNVYAWNSGGANINDDAWNLNYAGYYVEPSVSLYTWDRWATTTSPSFASSYTGCPVNIDNHSWSAKRQGFPCGHYLISIAYHDDAAQLFIDGVNVWEHDGCCDYHPNVWEGDLGENSKVEFRVTEGEQESVAGISINQKETAIIANGNMLCSGGSVLLTSNAASGNQ